MCGSSLPSGPGRALVAVAVVVVLTTSCGGSAGGGSSASGAKATTSRSPAASAPVTGPATLRISGFAFGPPLTVSPREKVRIINADGTRHTVTADRGNAFDVSVAGGDSATMTAPATAGSYPFHCSIHPSMKGVLTVR